MSPQPRMSTTEARSPTGTDTNYQGIVTQRELTMGVRFGFRVPTLLLIQAKHVALDQEAPLATLVRRWISEGLANGRDQPIVRVPTDGRLSEYPITMPLALRTSIHELSCITQLSGARLVRHWIAQGVALAELSANNPQTCEELSAHPAAATLRDSVSPMQ